ncbi:MAG: winged helix-turn-helix domain-containing protein [Nitrososphaeraceae archaeon]
MEVVEKQEKRKRHREQHRGNYEIVNDILQFVASKYNCNMAEVTFGASLTYYQQKRYLSLLTNRRLILISSESKYCKGYEISILGRRYLQVFAEIEDDLGYDSFQEVSYSHF